MNSAQALAMIILLGLPFVFLAPVAAQSPSCNQVQDPATRMNCQKQQDQLKSQQQQIDRLLAQPPAKLPEVEPLNNGPAVYIDPLLYDRMMGIARSDCLYWSTQITQKALGGTIVTPEGLEVIRVQVEESCLTANTKSAHQVVEWLRSGRLWMSDYRNCTASVFTGAYDTRTPFLMTSFGVCAEEHLHTAPTP